MAQDSSKATKDVNTKEKPTQVNKYSIHELKSGIDTSIIDVKSHLTNSF